MILISVYTYISLLMTEFLHLLVKKFLHFRIPSDVVVIVSVVILIGLFSMQHFGTDKVSWLFAPIVFVWYILIGILGAVNISKYDRSVLKAFNPVYVYRYFKRGKTSWVSLGGIMLSITGQNF